MGMGLNIMLPLDVGCIRAASASEPNPAVVRFSTSLPVTPHEPRPSLPPNIALPTSKSTTTKLLIRDASAGCSAPATWPARAWPSAEDSSPPGSLTGAGCIVARHPHARNERLGMLRRAARPRQRSLPVIFLTGHGDVLMAVGALKKGAFDFPLRNLSTTTPGRRVIRALEPRRRRRQAGAGNPGHRRHPPSPSSRREHEVIPMPGWPASSTRSSPTNWNISMRTVEVHRLRGVRKMGPFSGRTAQLLALGLI